MVVHLHVCRFLFRDPEKDAPRWLQWHSLMQADPATQDTVALSKPPQSMLLAPPSCDADACRRRQAVALVKKHPTVMDVFLY